MITGLLNFKSEEEIRDSEIAAKLNGYVTGKYRMKDHEAQIGNWDLDEQTKKSLRVELEKYM